MLEKSILFKRLKKLEKKEFSADSNPISSKITEELLQQSRDILSRISQYLPDYTLHDIQHSCRVLENIESIIPSTIKLNIVEIKILIYAVFLHDIGMTSDKIEEKLFNDYLENSDEAIKEKLFGDYIEKIKKKNILDTNLIGNFSKLLKVELDSYKNHDYSEYVRANHVRRSKMKLFLLKKNMDFDYKGVCLLNHIYDVILSHSLTFDDLKNESRYPIDEIISNKKVNILFLSTLLRVGDLLDADISRTPKYVYDFFQFKDKKSEAKWEKNLSLIGKQVTNYNVSFNYMSTSPEQERDIRRYIELVEVQLLNTNKVLKYSTKKLNLSPIINLIVRNNGSYKSADKKITIEYDKVKKIFMGLELYDNETMFVRELIQNSRDACKMREYYCEKLKIDYIPKILISFDEKERLLTVEDNGIGMNDTMINNFFIKIGNSSYSDENFYEKYNFYPIGHFGIGIFSAFMASNEINVNSIRFQEDGFFDKPVNIKLKIDEKYVIDYETDKNVHEGTRISMKLNDSAKKLDKEFILHKIKDTISDFFDVQIHFDNKILPESKNIDENEIDNDHLFLKKKNYTLKLKFNEKIDDNYNDGIIKLSYNGISIKNIRTGHMDSFLSYFFNCRSGYIEINGKINLSLKASRDEIIENDIFFDLVNEINYDLFNEIKKTKKENYLTSHIQFRKKYDIKVKELFFNTIKLKVYQNNRARYMKIINIIGNYNDIYILDKINIKNKPFLKNKSNDRSIFLNNDDKYISTVKSILDEYITQNEIIIENNIIFEKIKITSTVNNNALDKELPSRISEFIFLDLSDKKILFFTNDFTSDTIKINKNHKIGKAFYEGYESLDWRNLLELVQSNIYQVNKKLKKQYIKGIPKIFMGNFSKDIDSKKNIKNMNKYLKIITKELDIGDYKITKKDFLKSRFKITPL